MGLCATAIVTIGTHSQKTSVAFAVGDRRPIIARPTTVRLITEVSFTPCAVKCAGTTSVAGLRKANLTVCSDSERCRLTTCERKLEECVSKCAGYGTRVPWSLVVISNFVPQSHIDGAAVGIGEGDRIGLATDIAIGQGVHVVAISSSNVALVIGWGSIAMGCTRRTERAILLPIGRGGAFHAIVG